MLEEEIKVKIIIPYLQSLGLQFSDISLERSFKIQIGRFNEKIEWVEEIKQPRYDILVKVDGKNLFIIEVKTDDNNRTINDSDVSQARCYARLVDPIAPFTVVTNGTENKIVDSITGDELDGAKLNESNFAKNGFTIQLDPETRSIALSMLFSLNYHNLELFCNHQNNETLSKLRANNKDEHKKYISDVFVKRNHVNSVFYEFLKNDSSCLLITGNSGIGKTNVICNLVEETREKYPVFFYNASELSNELGSCIANDFNWEFPTHKPVQQLIKQIDDIVGKHNTKLVIFVDAIDEWSRSTASIDLSEFVQRIKEKQIKLILSCKNSKINEFLNIKGNPSTLSQNLFLIKNKATESFLTISEFDFPEQWEAIGKYSQYFSLTGFITTSETFQACKDPFLLRVLAETYAGKQVPPTLNSIEIYRNYIDTIFAKSNNKLELMGILTKLAKKIFEAGIEEVFQSEFDDNGSHLDFLIDYGILKQHTDNMGRSKFRFNSDGLLNYILAFHHLKLDQSSITDFEKFVSQYIDTELGGSLLIWYRGLSKADQLPILRQKIEENHIQKAHRYLSKLIEISKNDFPFILKIVGSENNLGLLVLYNEEYNIVEASGLKFAKENEEKITWLRKSQWFPINSTEWDIMERYGVPRLTFSSENFATQSLEVSVYQKILEITKELVKERRLDESKNIGIALEKFFLRLRHYSIFLGLPKYEQGFLSKVLPLQADNLLVTLRTMLYKPEYDALVVPSEKDSRPVIDLLESLDVIVKKNNTINSTLLPLGDEPRYPGWYHINRAEDYSKIKILEYVKKFFEVFLEEYQIMIETNFPTLKEKFPTYQKLPAYVIGQLHKREDATKATGLVYAICKNTEQRTETEIRDYDDEPIQVDNDPNSWGWIIKTKKGIFNTKNYSGGMILDEVFRSYVGGGGPYENCPVTSWIYNKIDQGLESIFGKQYRGY